MPPTTLPGSADSKNKFEDLSGVDIAAYENPYDALIEACNNDPVPAPFTCMTTFHILSDFLDGAFSEYSFSNVTT
jgi:hypothetical protein